MRKERIQAIQEEVCKTAQDMFRSGLVAGTWGNISARVDEEYMVITPSGLNYEKLCACEMVPVQIESLEYAGKLKPSIEALVHAQIYKHRKEVQGIVHTHSTYALTMASARKGIPPICDDQVQILGGDIKVADYTMPGTQEMADTILEAMKERAGALISNHGSIAVGRSVSEAYVAAQILEKAAKVYINAQSIGGAVEIERKDIEIFRDFFLHKYGQK